MNSTISTPRRVLIAVVLLTLPHAGGCANTTYRKATDPTANGIRYYRPATYILVKPDYAKGEASVTFFAGPDTSEPHAIDPFAVAAKNDTDIQFNNGVLSKVSSDVDSTKVAVDTITALGEVAKSVLQTAALAVGAAALKQKQPGQAPPIYLFMSGKNGFVQLYPPTAQPRPASFGREQATEPSRGQNSLARHSATVMHR